MILPKVTDTDHLRKIAHTIRRDVLQSLTASGSGHTGGSLGLTDVFTVLYFNRMHHDPQTPGLIDRDRLVLSIGHVAPVLYATLAHAGYFPTEELKSLRKLGSRLQGHPGRDHGLPGLELSAGSLGQGLSVAVGMAKAAKMDGENHRIYCVNGDGELQEGSIWEAAMSAAHHRLDNLISVVDRNRVQIDGRVSEVMEIDPLADKWKAFGWEVFECDGNNVAALIETFDRAESTKNKPAVIIAHTLMGKGVKSIEDDYRWHGKAPNAGELEELLKELDQSSSIINSASDHV